MMMYWGILLCIAGALAYDWQQYQGYRVVNFWPKTNDQMKAVLEFGELEGVSVWSEPHMGAQTDFFVSPHQYNRFIVKLQKMGIRYENSGMDVAADMKVEWERLVARGYPDKMVYDPLDFNTRIDIEGEMDRLAGLCAGVGLTCTNQSLPELTHDGNQIKVLQIRGGVSPRNTIQWESLIHCREWIAGATLMNIIDRMITGYGTDAEATFLIDNYDYDMIPIMNPDGYDVTFGSDRLWRKNRRVNEGSTCLGVDLNRNYDANWSEPGASSSPCSDTFYGPGAGSEPETTAVVNHIMSNTGLPFIMDVSHHSYGYYLLAPFGNGTIPLGLDGERLMELTDTGCAAIQGTWSSDTWRCGNSMYVLYETSGGSTDWMIQVAGMKYSWVPELRGNGFVIAASEIPFSVDEIWNGLYAMVEQMSGYADPK